MRSLTFHGASRKRHWRCPWRMGTLLSVICISASVLSADEPETVDSPAARSAQVPEQTTIKTERFLGVVTEPIPEALAAQLKEVLAAGRGLLVTRVLPDSPAEKAGVQPFDVISAADSQPLTAPDQLKSLVTSAPAGQMLKLEFIRGAKVQVVDVQPGERTVSRLVVRHLGSSAKENTADAVAEKSKTAPGVDQLTPLPAYSVGVQTRDGKNFQVEVHVASETGDPPTQKLTGSITDISTRLKALPEPIQRSVTRQMARLSEDRQTLRTVQFRFQPRRDGNRQVLAVTLRKPEADGTVKSFELQHPMGDAVQPTPLEQVLRVPDFAAQLKSLDPAVREKIESTLKTASLPAATVKVEQSQ